ncbi:hypothetical protein FHT71_002740 [Rhizobium sp. BK060]|nr:hypothetical protein [Rhizobium sp. BK060]
MFKYGEVAAPSQHLSMGMRAKIISTSQRAFTTRMWLVSAPVFMAEKYKHHLIR